ncbi:MAG: tetratricopeptide repeat protein [Alphaproteobacteria bacterium]|nr:tetratricopeptide repeat protein [Alphaproteobacteria bacterium]
MISTRTLRVSNFVLLCALTVIGALLAPVTSFAWSNGELETARSLPGSYLAGRFARSNNDTGQAAGFYRNALVQDPDSGILLERAFLMEASEANWDRAIALAEDVVKRQPRHRMARLLLGLQDFKSGDFEKSIENFKAAGSGPIGELTSVITRAWVEQARGRTIEALSSLTLRKQADWARFYLRYHRALIADQAGRSSDAQRAFESVFQQDNKTLRTALAYTRSVAASGDYRRAKGILRNHMRQSAGEDHPLAVDLMDKLTRGENIGSLISTPQEGLAEVFYGLGEALTGEGGVSIGILYLQMALYLEPRHPFALAALASAYESMKRFEKAIETYDRIPDGSALQLAVDIRKAFNLNELERVDDARLQLEKVAADYPDSIKPYDALGNIMRGRKRYDEAIGYYSKVIDLIGKPEEKDWVYFYSRGTCYERTKQWAKAEIDLQQALKLDPNQALTLNYLGYSWIDQNLNLREGMKLIEKAVSLKPDDGYIVDSLGWAHYRTGDYQEAVRFLEKAVELRPEDPVLNDHLGDAYWQVGRIREARFQWDQALSLKPEPDLVGPIEKKLAEGLPVKRQALAAPSLTGTSAPVASTTAPEGNTDGVPLPQRRQ